MRSSQDADQDGQDGHRGSNGSVTHATRRSRTVTWRYDCKFGNLSVPVVLRSYVVHCFLYWFVSTEPVRGSMYSTGLLTRRGIHGSRIGTTCSDACRGGLQVSHRTLTNNAVITCDIFCVVQA